VTNQPSQHDVDVIKGLANSISPEEALGWLEDNECLAEQSWLSAAGELLERQWVLTVMTAYAHANGALDSIGLSLPPAKDGKDE